MIDLYINFKNILNISHYQIWFIIMSAGSHSTLLCSYEQQILID